ncbi:restriction endonuclease subunit S [Enterococcus faecium]|uniref:restriction endonuclease subunit S n=2 Tax=Enterococcus faecium TaxID=1352 RepID=UPI000DD4BACD|nr:restriction endonuclease subunit S [Enterococcus faecium]EGP5570220.1 restriction endonuclease subunit S [Enterococcus faecium]EME8173297.1 restriction endonuclease subunit S [Enterococcus faecium]MBZ3655102.1 restriction endonuclease subunit S [Enterococcus faecium]MCU7776716.1 restriction endonuclease subunit S [Enterococcus faecium]UYT90388.1 restriction endonuclease subunit S [Enterococcus faecium]
MSNDARPEIRFPGFTDDWEQRKLGEVADIIGGGTPNTNNPEYWNGDIDWYAPAEIGKQIYVKNSQKKISQLGLQKSSAKILPIGTVLFTSRAGIGNTAILAKEGTTNQGFQSIVPHENKLDSYFIFSRTHELKRYGEVTGAGSTFAEVSGKQMAKMPILIPYIDEQQKIGIFFKKLDDTITLHQRKLDLLKETKKGFLQKMFPKNGAKVPEIRFPGFTEDWEARKLIDYLDVSTQKNKDEIYDKGDVLSVSGDCGIVNQIEFQGRSFAGVSVANYGVVETGDIVYTKSPLKANPYGIIKTNKGKTGIVSTLYAVYKPKQITDPEFVQIYFEQDVRMNNYMRPLVNKGAKNDMKVSDENALKGEVMFPKLEEQRKISSYFEQLNNLITLHQRELDLLKETKKGFLQKMFV